MHLEHYWKPMSNHLVPLSMSAVPFRVKRTTHMQEPVRILKYCKEELSCSCKGKRCINHMIWESLFDV